MKSREFAQPSLCLLHAHVDQSDVRVVILRSTVDNVFCAGADLKVLTCSFLGRS